MSDKRPQISEISESERVQLSQLFLKEYFVEPEVEMSLEDIAIADGTSWEVSIYDSETGDHRIYGQVGEISEIPLEGARKLFEIVQKIRKTNYL